MAHRDVLSLLDLSAFCESMAVMLKAGVEVSEAVELLKLNGEGSGLSAAAVERMKEALEKGLSFHEAMAAAAVFPDYALTMFEAGEKTGRLDEVLLSLAAYYEGRYQLKDRIRNAITFPLIMTVMIIIVLFIMLKAVLPAFRDVYVSLTGALNAGSYAYIDYAYRFCEGALIALLLIVALVLSAFLLYRSPLKGKIEAVLSLDPNCSLILEDLALYRFTSAYEVYLSSGILNDEAIDKAAQAVEYGPVAERVKICRQKMAEGQGFAKSADDAGLYRVLYARTLIPAERSGDLDSALKRLTEMLKNDVEKHSDQLTDLLEGVLSGVLMITIAVALLSVMLPLIGIMNSIG